MSQRLRSRKVFLPILALTAVLAYVGFQRYQAWLPYEWSGTVEARTIEVGSLKGGRVKEVLVREGERVKEGQPLLVLEAGDLEAQVLQSEAQVRQAEAAFDKLAHGSRPEEVDEAKARTAGARAALAMSTTGARIEEVGAARARREGAQAALDKAQLDLDRVHQLFASNAVSKAEVDNAETALKSARALVDAAESNLAELTHGSRHEEIQQAAARAAEAQAQANVVSSGARVEDRQAAQAAVDVARARLLQLRVAVDELTIRAPRATRVETLDLRPGDLLGPSAQAATLVEDDALYVRIYVPETQLGLVSVGKTLPVYVDSFPGRAFSARVTRVNSVGEYSPRNLQTADERAFQVFAARLDLTEGVDALRAGMAATAKVPK